MHLAAVALNLKPQPPSSYAMRELYDWGRDKWRSDVKDAVYMTPHAEQRHIYSCVYCQAQSSITCCCSFRFQRVIYIVLSISTICPLLIKYKRFYGFKLCWVWKILFIVKRTFDSRFSRVFNKLIFRKTIRSFILIPRLRCLADGILNVLLLIKSSCINLIGISITAFIKSTFLM